MVGEFTANPASSNLSAADTARPVVSIVLCTHNRVDYLCSALQSLFDQGATVHTYELLLVDNCSTDETAALGRKLATQGLLRYVPERELGLCHARNTGWRHARGQYVAYFDDDALAEPGWIDAVVDAFAQVPDAGVVGGRVEPMWEAPRPPWLSDGIAVSLTIVDWSRQPKKIPDVRVEWLVGANMAIPRHVLEEIGGFDPRLDRIGTNMLSGGDVYLQKAIIARGYTCFYYPQMAIRHLASRGRLNKAWFEKRYYWQGISDAVMTLIGEHPSPRRRAVIAGRSLAKLLRRPGEIANLFGSSEDPIAFQRRCWTLIEVGYIAGMLGKARA